MFIQVFEAKIDDAELWARQCEIWRTTIKPKTKAFRGYTSGVTDDGYMITLARFTSAEAAQTDSQLPEQGAWFDETAKAFDGEVTFHDCTQVDVLLDGGSDEAGFVQIIRGRAKDEQVMRNRLKEMEADLRTARPDLIGGYLAWHGDGTFTEAVYFASEAAARQHEQAMERTSVQRDFLALIDGELTFYDFLEPDLV